MKEEKNKFKEKHLKSKNIKSAHCAFRTCTDHPAAIEKQQVLELLKGFLCRADSINYVERKTSNRVFRSS